MDGGVQGLQVGIPHSPSQPDPHSWSRLRAVTSIAELPPALPTSLSPPRTLLPPRPPHATHMQTRFQMLKYRHAGTRGTQHIHTGTQTYMFIHIQIYIYKCTIHMQTHTTGTKDTHTETNIGKHSQTHTKTTTCKHSNMHRPYTQRHTDTHMTR